MTADADPLDMLKGLAAELTAKHARKTTPLRRPPTSIAGSAAAWARSNRKALTVAAAATVVVVASLTAWGAVTGSAPSGPAPATVEQGVRDAEIAELQRQLTAQRARTRELWLETTRQTLPGDRPDAVAPQTREATSVSHDGRTWTVELDGTMTLPGGELDPRRAHWVDVTGHGGLLVRSAGWGSVPDTAPGGVVDDAWAVHDGAARFAVDAAPPPPASRAPAACTTDPRDLLVRMRARQIGDCW